MVSGGVDEQHDGGVLDRDADRGVPRGGLGLDRQRRAGTQFGRHLRG